MVCPSDRLSSETALRGCCLPLPPPKKEGTIIILLAAAVSNDRWPDTYLARERHRRHRPLPVRWDLPGEEEEEELSE